MRWQSRLAIGALVLLPSVGVSGVAAAGAATTSSRGTPDQVQRSISANRSGESAVITSEPDGRRPAHSIRPVLGDLPTSAALSLAAWVLVGIIAALVSSVASRLAPRGRAPPLRFL